MDPRAKRIAGAAAAAAALALALVAAVAWRGGCGARGGTAATGPATGGAAPAGGGGGSGVAAGVSPAAPAAPGAARPPGPPFVLEGTVRDALTGEALERADVLALPLARAAAGAAAGPGTGASPGTSAGAGPGTGGGSGGLAATSDDAGRFAFAGLAPGWYRLRPDVDGYHLAEEDEPAVLVRAPAPGVRAPHVELRLVPLAELSGQVIARAGGKPVDGAEVRCAPGASPVDPDAPPDDAPPGVGRARSDGFGRFDVICLPGEVVLLARRDGLANGRSEPVRVGPAGHLGGLVIVLGAGTARDFPPSPPDPPEPDEPAVLRGRVLDPDGRPVATFRVVAAARGGRTAARVFAGATDGRFEMAGLWPGRYNVLASETGAGAGGRAPARAADVALPPGGDTDAGDLVLGPAAAVAGRVTDRATGRPVPGASVTVSGSVGDVAPHLGDDVFSGDDGAYVLDGVLPGKRTIEFSHPAYDHLYQTGVVLEAGTTVKLDVALAPRAKKGAAGAIEYAGIGAVLAKNGPDLVVTEVLDGGPARAAGLLARDVVRTIDGAPTAGMGFTDAIESLRGVAGTTVRLEVVRGTASFVIDVVRAQLAIPPPPDDE
jgi:protocatechuate 3,4-dioxygenase beta subunit